jgi:hypothetical protein
LCVLAGLSVEEHKVFQKENWNIFKPLSFLSKRIQLTDKNQIENLSNFVPRLYDSERIE